MLPFVILHYIYSGENNDDDDDANLEVSKDALIEIALEGNFAPLYRVGLDIINIVLPSQCLR